MLGLVVLIVKKMPGTELKLMLKKLCKLLKSLAWTNAWLKSLRSADVIQHHLSAMEVENELLTDSSVLLFNQAEVRYEEPLIQINITGQIRSQLNRKEQSWN